SQTSRLSCSSRLPRPTSPTTSTAGCARTEQALRIRARHGWPEDNPTFYRNLSVGPRFKDAVTKGPVLLFHGTGDTNTPFAWSERTAALMKDAGINVTFVPLPGENHLFSDAAWRGSVASQFLAFIDR